MKTVWLAACVLLVAGTVIRASDSSESAFAKDMKELAGMCGEEVGLSKAEAEDPSMYKKLDEDKVACMMSCILAELKLMVDGKIQEDAVNELMDKLQSEMEDKNKMDKLRNITNNCIADTKDIKDDCDLAYQLIECINTNMEE